MSPWFKSDILPENVASPETAKVPVNSELPSTVKRDVGELVPIPKNDPSYTKSVDCVIAEPDAFVY